MEEERRRLAQRADEHRMELQPNERTWMERYHILFEQGFQLRPRLRPGWQQSLAGPDGNATLGEERTVLRVSLLVQAHSRILIGDSPVRD